MAHHPTIEDSVRYRDNNQCQARKTGCLHTCDYVQHALTIDELTNLHKDPTTADTYWCICASCAEEGS